MAQTDILPLGPTRHITAVLRHAATCWARISDPTPPIEDRERHRFVQETLLENPDAFSSEYDVQTLMLHYPSHL